MLRREQYKYVHYSDNPPQLFDLEANPDETENLATDPASDSVRADLEHGFRDRLDLEAVDRRARWDQQERFEELTDEE